MTEYKEDLKNHKKEVRQLKEAIKDNNSTIKELTDSNDLLVKTNDSLKKDNFNLQALVSALKDAIQKIKTIITTEVINGLIPKSILEKLENLGLFKTEKNKEVERTK